MKPVNEPGQTMQRVKVAFTGLAIVLVLIGLASLILGSFAHRTGSGAGTVGTGGAGHSANAADPSEPLAELGVTPSTQGNSTPGGDAP